MRILWIPHTGWHIPQRAHSFCRELSKRHEVHVTDWVADFYTLGDYFSTKYLRNFTYRKYRDGNIQVHGIPRISPALYLPALRMLNSWIFSNYVQKIIWESNIDVVVGTFIARPPKARRLIFDLFDDNVAYWRDYKKNTQYASEIEKIEIEYIKKADQIVSISSILARQVEAKTGSSPEKIKIIPNGVDLKRFQQDNNDDLRKSLGLEGYRIIGYISAFGEFAGLPRLIEAFRLLNDTNLILLLVGDGPQLGIAQSLARKYGLNNIVFCGKISFCEIHRYYNLIDLGVIPFDKTAFTDASCPIKLLEYSAANKVVVSSKLAEIQNIDFPNVIFADPEPTSWAECIKLGLTTRYIKPNNLEKYDIPNLTKEYEEILSG
jgi:glycosyltransferase involved in cell wall biosynthesis